MNKQRKIEITSIKEELDDLRERLEALQYEEQEVFDNLSDGLQNSVKGISISDCIENLEEACNSMQEASDSLDKVI